MKKTIFALLTCAILASCSESEKSEPIVEKELVPVSFNLGFSKEVVDFRSTTARGAGDDPVISNLDYLVFNKETGNLYKQKTLNINNGIATDELPEGEYFFFFSYGCPVYSPGDIFSTNALNWTCAGREMFLCRRIDYEVKKGSENSCQVVLERMIGKVEIVLADIIPDNVIELELTITKLPIVCFYNGVSDSYYSASSWEPERRTYRISDADKTSSGYTMSFMGFESVDMNEEYLPITVTLVARRANIPNVEGLVDYTDNPIIATKTINNVYIERNKTVIYTGKLFDNIIVTPEDPNEKVSSSFSVLLNDEWGDVIDETF